MNLLGFLIIIISIVLILVFEFAPLKTDRFGERPMKGVKHMRDQIELSVEDGSQLMMGIGNGSLIDDNTVATLTAQTTAKHIFATTAYNDVAPVISSGDGATFLLNQDLIHNHTNYSNKELSQMNRLDGVNPMSYAVGISSTVRDEAVSFCATEGNYGEEIMLINDAVMQKDIDSFVATNNLIGQAVSLPHDDEMLLGEEYFIINTYLGDEKKRRKQLLVHDILRWLVILIFIIITLINLIGAII